MSWQLALWLVATPIAFTGCAVPHTQWERTVKNDTAEIDRITQQVDKFAPSVYQEVAMTSAPVTALSVTESEITHFDMTLDEVLSDAMEHSTILRDIGGIVLRAPNTVNSRYATRLQETDPRFGAEAALSAFDAQLKASATFNNNNRIYNNSFFAGGATFFQQDLNDYQVEVSKRTASGSLLAVRGVSDYDANNAPANTFASSWNSWLEGEIRQPLLQGGGLEFNRIAGPGSTPGIYNGVLIAKANSDINHAEFMASLRDYVSNVENAYWDLYLSYRELDARKKSMEKSLVVWNEAKAKDKFGNSEIAEEALARQQYYQLKADVDEALSGRLLQGTRTSNGSSGGTVQLAGGVLTAERRLRLLVGRPAADGHLIRPSEEPTMAEIRFDWPVCRDEAVRQRPELQRQHVAVKKREMELLAAKNFLNPRLDAFGRYRWRGFGDSLIGSGIQTGTSPASSLGNLATGDQQEWMLGVELTVPIGYRKAHAAVQNAELSLARERAIQKEQQREVVNNLSGAIADAVRAFQAIQNNLNQYLGAKDYLKALEARRGGAVNDGADRILDAQRRLVQSEIQFFRSRAEYAVALKNVHYEKGSLLRYKDLRVAEGARNKDIPPEQEIPDGEPISPLPMASDSDVQETRTGDATAENSSDGETDTVSPPVDHKNEYMPHVKVPGVPAKDKQTVHNKANPLRNAAHKAVSRIKEAMKSTLPVKHSITVPEKQTPSPRREAKAEKSSTPLPSSSISILPRTKAVGSVLKKRLSEGWLPTVKL
ncbi:MAG: TolC family protein [Fuerstiella sp.]